MWCLFPLLLAAALTIPLLDVDAFNGDEPTLVAAGALRSGPLFLDATWSYITYRNPHQAYGWPLLLSVWGRLVGWERGCGQGPFPVLWRADSGLGLPYRVVIFSRRKPVSSQRCCSVPPYFSTPI